MTVLLGLALVLSAAQDRRFPAFQAGAQDMVFEESPPHLADEELRIRFGASDKIPPYDVTKEKFRVVVPRSYRHETPWGLFVYINAGDSPGIPARYLPVLEKRRLLAVAAYRSGNPRNIFDRFRLAIDANFNMDRRFNIDPDRVYVSGFSGGGRVASMLAVAYADLFNGAIPLCGVNFYTRIPHGADKVLPPNYIPAAPVLKVAREKGRYVLVTGEKDFNRDNTRSVFEHGFRKQGFRHALLLEVPGMKHAPPPAEWLEKGLEFLDRPK